MKRSKLKELIKEAVEGESKPITHISGVKRWRLPNGRLHRKDGPAIIYPDGSEQWWLNGKNHREDGPAITDENGEERWFLRGEEYTELQWEYEMRVNG